MLFVTKIIKMKLILISIDNIRIGDFPDIQLISKCNKDFFCTLFSPIENMNEMFHIKTI